MAYKPGIFQYNEFDLDNEDPSAYDQGPITTLPPFNVNEPPGFNNLNDLDLYNAGLSNGNIFYGGYGPGDAGSTPDSGTGGVQPPADDGGYKDPVNIADYKKGLIGPAGYASGRTELPPINPPGPVVLPKVEVPIGQQGEVGAGGYTDAVNHSLFTQGLIGPAGYGSGTLPSVGLINPPATVNLPQVEVAGTKINDGTQVEVPSGVPLTYSGPSMTFSGPIANPGGPINLPAVSTSSVKPSIGTAPLTYSGPPSGGFVGPITNPGGAINLPPVTVTEPPIAPPVIPPTVLPPFIVSDPPITPPVIPPPVIPPVTPPVTPPPVIPPPVTPPPVTPPPVIPPVPFDPNTVNSGVGTYGTNAQTLTTKRDFGKELEETLAALQKNQSGIMGMYGDLYKQFMPKGITDTESSVIDQYKTDLARLQQRQAGVLAPEDIRQSQQAAREAYGARGQVMGRGAVGAEIMGRENIRQQREDQARAGMQASYGNIMNMANLQTGNIFSPIGNLMSNTFNPVSPYAGDVYGTNVNAQLAKEIAQKNYDAAVRSAELQGSAVKSASNTSLFGDLLKVGGSVKIAMLCMPGYQEIDTPNGPVPIQDLRGGDYVIGYDNTVKRIEQLCSYVENPESEFLEFTLANGGKITVCGPHKILDIPAREWVVGSEMNGVPIVSIGKVTGITTSYDLLTDVGGYRIAGVPVNSMIPEMIVQTIKQVLLNHA